MSSLQHVKQGPMQAC